MHTRGAHVSKSVHPSAKMCTQGAGRTLNFEHYDSMSVNKCHIRLIKTDSHVTFRSWTVFVKALT